MAPTNLIYLQAMNHNIANITTICSLLLTAQSLTEAATVTWDGSTNTSWGNTNNWSTSSVPTFSDTVVFDGTASRFTVDLGSSDREIDDLIFDSATIYTLTGDQTLLLDDVSVESGYRHVIEPNIALSTSSSVWDINTGAYLVVSGVISGGGTLRKDGGGLLTLNNNMTYSGATTVNDGTLAVATTKANGLANSAVTVNSGGLLTLDANGTGNSFNVGSLAGSGTTEIDGGHVTFGADNSSTTFSGTLRDTYVGGSSSSVTKAGTGTWTLTGALTGMDAVNVENGTLHINGATWDVTSTADWLIESADGTSTAALELTGISVDHSNFDLTIGDTQPGALTLNAGSSLRADHVYLGAGDGGSAALKIFGEYATGTPYLQANNMTIGDAVSGNGSATFDFDNSSSESGFIALGDADFSSLQGSADVTGIYLSNSDENNGVLTLQGGADLELIATNADHALNIGSFSGEYGKVQAGDGSQITTDKKVIIGGNGTGILALTGDASLTTTGTADRVYLGDEASGHGIWTGAHGDLGASLYIGNQGRGEVYLSSGDDLTISYQIYMAEEENSEGYLELTSGAKLSTSGIYIANSGDADVLSTDSEIVTTNKVSVGKSVGNSGSGNTGTLTVNGGSLQVGSYLEVGYLTTGYAYFQNGAEVSVGADLLVGKGLNPADSETALLSLSSTTFADPTFLDISRDAEIEANATWTTDALSNVRIGDGDLSTVTASGYVFISDTTGDGGTLTLTKYSYDGPIAATFGGELLVGWNAGESGTVNLFTNTTVFTTEDDVRLGENGTATVNMNNSAIWNANGSAFDMADQTGTATLTLQNSSQLISDGTIYAGDGTGTADINILSGSTLEGTRLYLGDGASTGTLTVDAANLNLSLGLYVGEGSSSQNGIGTASFTNSSVLTIDRSMSVGDEGTGTVTIDDSNWISTTSDSSRISAGGGSSGDGTVTIQNGSTITIENIYLGVDGTGSLTVDGAGTVLTQLNDATYLTLGDESNGSGTMTIQNGASHIYQETNNTYVRIGDEGLGHYTVTGSGSSSAFSADVNVGYTSTAAGSSLSVLDGASFTGTDITLANTTSLTIDGAGTELTLSGTLSFGATETVSLTNGATLKTPSISGNLTNASGTFSPGTSPAHTTLTGNYTQESSGTLEIELAGTTQGTEYDFLDISGTATLAGTINISFIEDYTPTGGETFTILSHGALVDNGVGVTLPSLSTGLTWTTDWTSSSLTLTVAYSESVDGFRAQYGLASDGSDDALDWSENGIENILYYAFGLGDPNEASVDRSRLPAMSEGGEADISITFVALTDADVGIYYQFNTSDDLATWWSLNELDESYHPAAVGYETLDESYTRVTVYFDTVEGETARFYTVEVLTHEEDLN